MPITAQSTSCAVIIVVTLMAMVWDLTHRQIPNSLTVTAAIAGIAWHLVLGNSASLIDATSAFVFGFGCLLIVWLIGGGGGGDTKLIGALAIWLGFQSTLQVLVLSALFIAIYSFVMLCCRWIRMAVGNNADAAGDGLKLIPFAVPVSLATWAVLGFQWMRQNSIV